MDINVLVTLLFGGGAGGVVIGIMNVTKQFRSGKIESEDTLLRRIDADNKNQQRLREEAERRAEEAEGEAEGYRRERNRARDQLARVRWHVMQKYGDDLKEFGGDNE